MVPPHRRDGVVRFTRGFYQAAGRGDFAAVTPRLGELLGREPRAAREALAEPSAPYTA